MIPLKFQGVKVFILSISFLDLRIGFRYMIRNPSEPRKKSISDEKKTFSPPAAAKPRIRQTISMPQFYKAERKAFKPGAVEDAFMNVALVP